MTAPHSLRDFLLVTNGWRHAGNFIYRLAGAAELEWLRDTDDRTWIDVWEDLAEGDADQDEDGEWAAYWLASWSGEGPERYGSFHGLMHRQWVSFHALRKPPGATQDHWDAKVERARCEALAGAVDAPLSVFAQAHEYGRERADVLSMQMKAMLGDWRGHIARLTWYRPGNDDFLLSPLFAAELLPLLVRQDQLARPHDLRPLPRLKEHAPAPVRALVAGYEAQAAEPGLPAHLRRTRVRRGRARRRRPPRRAVGLPGSRRAADPYGADRRHLVRGQQPAARARPAVRPRQSPHGPRGPV